MAVFSRFWNTVKLPDAGPRPAESAQKVALRRRQRRLISITIAAFVLIAAALGIYQYIDSGPQRADAQFQAGMRVLRPGTYAEAVAHFNRALVISPQLTDAYMERGNAHRFLGEADAALADYQSAVNLNPNLVAAHNGIAVIYRERHDLAHALEELNKSIELEPSIEGYYQRGLILEAQGDHRKAIEDFDRAIAVARDSPYMYRARALAKTNLGDEDGARADRDAALAIERSQ